MTWMQWSIVFQAVLSLASAFAVLWIFSQVRLAKSDLCILSILAFVSLGAQRVLFILEDPELDWQAITIWRKVVFQTLTPALFLAAHWRMAARLRSLRSTRGGRDLLEDVRAATTKIVRRGGGTK